MSGEDRVAAFIHRLWLTLAMTREYQGRFPRRKVWKLYWQQAGGCVMSDAAYGPRAEAYERTRAREVCEREGHLPEEIEWYERSRHDRPCRRGCGESVRPKIDYSGHP